MWAEFNLRAHALDLEGLGIHRSRSSGRLRDRFSIYGVLISSPDPSLLSFIPLCIHASGNRSTRHVPAPGFSTQDRCFLPHQSSWSTSPAWRRGTLGPVILLLESEPARGQMEAEPELPGGESACPSTQLWGGTVDAHVDAAGEGRTTATMTLPQTALKWKRSRQLMAY